MLRRFVCVRPLLASRAVPGSFDHRINWITWERRAQTEFGKEFDYTEEESTDDDTPLYPLLNPENQPDRTLFPEDETSEFNSSDYTGSEGEEKFMAKYEDRVYPSTAEEEQEEMDATTESSATDEEDVQTMKSARGIINLIQRLEVAKDTRKELDKVLESEDLSNYSPFYDSKYKKEKLTKKSSTYMDIIRFAPKKKIDIPMDVQVKNARAFNLTLLELFKVGQVLEARDYFFVVTRREDSPADLNSYNIAIAEFVNAEEIPLASVIFELLRQSKFEPNVVTYNSMISACVKYSSVSGAQNYLLEMKERGIEPNQTTKEYLIALYLKAKDIDTAFNYLQEIGENNVSNYVFDLFARAYAIAEDFEKMHEFAWKKGERASDYICSSIVTRLVDRFLVGEAQFFIQQMIDHNAKLSWSASERVVEATQDQRYEYPMNPTLEKFLSIVTKEPNEKERLETIRTTTIKELEDEAVFRKRPKRAPIWKRKVEYKNPADTAWDTLIQEYLAIAIKEDKLRKTYAAERRQEMDASRGIDPDALVKRPKPKRKQRQPWTL